MNTSKNPILLFRVVDGNPIVEPWNYNPVIGRHCDLSNNIVDVSKLPLKTLVTLTREAADSSEGSGG